jgi:hypothetical protein
VGLASSARALLPVSTSIMLNALIILIFLAAEAVTGFIGVELQWLGGAELAGARWVAMGICSLISLPLKGIG